MLKINKETTKEEIFAPLEAAKEELAIEASKALESEYVAGEYLVTRAQQVRNAEALVRAQTSYLRALNRNDESAKDVLFDLVTEMDDTYSGRGNDSIRASYDGVRRWARFQFMYL